MDVPRDEEYEAALEEEHNSQSGFPIGKELVLLAVLVGLIFGTAIVPRVFDRTVPAVPEEQLASLPYTEEKIEPRTEVSIDVYDEVRVGARAALVYDVNENRVLYEEAPDSVLPLASLTKLMTALLAYELVESGTAIALPRSAIEQEGDSGLFEGEVFALEKLTDLTLITSANDGAYALAEAAGDILVPGGGAPAFIEAMNIRAEELGMSDTTFYNPTGLDLSPQQSGAKGSAKDMIILVTHILDVAPEILEGSTTDTTHIRNQNGDFHEVHNTSTIINDIPGLIGSKTGFTDLAGGNLVVVYDASLSRPIIVVVLGSTKSGRFNDVMKLVEATNERNQ